MASNSGLLPGRPADSQQPRPRALAPSPAAPISASTAQPQHAGRRNVNDRLGRTDPTAAAHDCALDWDLAFWEEVCRRSSRRDVIRLSATCRRLRPLHALLRAEGWWKPSIEADGLVGPPPSQHGDWEVELGEDIQHALDTCPLDSAIYLSPGKHVLRPGRFLVLSRRIHLFGPPLSPRATLVNHGDNFAIDCTAVHATIHNITVRFGGLCIYGGSPQITKCTFYGCGVYIRSRRAHPTLAANIFQAGSNCGLGVAITIKGRAKGLLINNFIRGYAHAGIEVDDAHPSLSVTRNVIVDCPVGIHLNSACPHSLALGGGNSVRGRVDTGAVLDDRLLMD